MSKKIDIKVLIVIFMFFSLLSVFPKSDRTNVKVNINSNPRGANFTLAGSQNVYTTPATLTLRVGRSYQITFSKAGYSHKIITYTAGRGDIMVNLRSDNGPPVGKEYRLRIDSNVNGARVFINENKSGKTPLKVTLKKGSYEIRLRLAGYKPYVTSIYLNSNQSIYAKLVPDVPQQRDYRLKINSNMEGAKVYINGENYGRTPLTVSLKEGNYEIKVKHPGYKAFVRSIYLNSDETIFADLDSDKINLSINSNVGGAKVFINGERYGKAPVSVSLDPGRYNIQVKADGYKTFERNINLISDETVFANLTADRFINIKLPTGTKIYINGEMQKINWGKKDGNWKTFTFYGDSELNEVKVVYHGITVTKSIRFDGSSVSLVGDIM